ncbi:MAG: cytochrome c3 family protein [Coriobacteriia bacterium]|nr:cytochrome c3 family protein [Coriobacteriia bacterium]
MRIRSIMLAAVATVAFSVLYFGAASTALAFNETNWAGGAMCQTCHTAGIDVPGISWGPHSGYTRSTDICTLCHTVHAAPSSNHLLPGETIKATCATCHDGSGGQGVYGTIKARGLTVGGEHTVEDTSVVPGGSTLDGRNASMSFAGEGGTLTCSDCHSPHGNDAVTPFLGERQRSAASIGNHDVNTSNRLLKRRPGGVTTPVAEYGSDWCLACHKGRASDLPAVMNHPVESSATVGAPYNYRELGIIGPGPYPTADTVLGPAGINTKYSGYNRAYLMPYPRAGAQAGHLPICQQCHEDTRDVGALTADGTRATPTETSVTVTLGADGRNPADNPRFQNFPHETTGFRLLVEADTLSSGDDLCTNCHPPSALP